MKALFLFALVSLSPLLALPVSYGELVEPSKDQTAPFQWDRGWRPSFRLAAFLPLSKGFREVYGEAILQYQAEVEKDFRSPFLGFVNLSGLSKSGSSVGLNTQTYTWLIPLSTGVKVKCTLLRNVDGYLGFGPSYSWMEIHNLTSFVAPRISSSGFGFVVKSNLRYHYKRFSADIFADYLYTKLRFGGYAVSYNPAEASGFSIGGAIGYCF